MEKNVLNTDLNGKVAVVTGASGLFCNPFSVDTQSIIDKITNI